MKKNNRKTIIVLCIIVLLLVFIFGMVFFRRFSLPRGTDHLFVEIGCAKVKEEIKIEKSPGTVSFICSKYDSASNTNNTGYIRHLASILRTLDYSITDDEIKDIEAVKFSFRDGNQNELWTVLFAYDFYQEKTYALINNTWHTVEADERLNSAIEDILGLSFGHSSYRWRGQSTFSFEEFTNTNMDNPSFRYHLYWFPKDRPDKDLHDFKDSGFINNTPVTINSADEAIERAAQELGYSNAIGFAFYDETCGYWMVELYDDEGYDRSNTSDFTNILADKVVTLIMDKNGITKETYTAITRLYPFLNQEILP